MDHAFIFDCEFLTSDGAPSRFWCGPFDPDPTVAQIGIVKIGLSAPFPVVDTLRCYVVPKDRDGARKPLDPLFTKLTGITEEDIDNEGMDLTQALDVTQQFAAGEKLWSWGKDEFNLIAISCYVEGIAPPIPVSQFGNACNLLLKAGMPYADLQKGAQQYVVPILPNRASAFARA